MIFIVQHVTKLFCVEVVISWKMLSEHSDVARRDFCPTWNFFGFSFQLPYAPHTFIPAIVLCCVVVVFSCLVLQGDEKDGDMKHVLKEILKSPWSECRDEDIVFTPIGEAKLSV